MLIADVNGSAIAQKFAKWPFKEMCYFVSTQSLFFGRFQVVQRFILCLTWFCLLSSLGAVPFLCMTFGTKEL